VGRDGHDDARRVVGVDEARGQDQYLVAGDRIGHLRADDVAAGERLVDLYVALLQAELLGGVLGDEPLFPIDVGSDVRHLGVDVGVGDALDRLRSEGRHRRDDVVGLAVVALEFGLEANERVFLELGFLTLQQVVGGDWLLLVGAVLHGVEPAVHQPALAERLVLPGDELRVPLVVGGELTAPVDGEPQLLHPCLVVVLDEAKRAKPIGVSRSCSSSSGTS